jgi:hypothetical protein
MANFSPTFCIDIKDDFGISTACVVTNPGQAFELVDVVVSGTATAVATVKKNTSGGATAAVATVIAAGSSCQITDANSSFAAADNVWVGVATAAATRVTLICRSAIAATWANTIPA